MPHTQEPPKLAVKAGGAGVWSFARPQVTPSFAAIVRDNKSKRVNGLQSAAR